MSISKTMFCAPAPSNWRRESSMAPDNTILAVSGNHEELEQLQRLFTESSWTLQVLGTLAEAKRWLRTKPCSRRPMCAPITGRGLEGHAAGDGANRPLPQSCRSIAPRRRQALGRGAEPGWLRCAAVTRACLRHVSNGERRLAQLEGAERC